MLWGIKISPLGNRLAAAEKGDPIRRGRDGRRIGVEGRLSYPELFLRNMAKVCPTGKGKSAARSETFQPFSASFHASHHCFLLPKGDRGGILPRFA